MPEDEVILVDENDHETGTAGKLQAHLKGQLHRAFSVFVFNSKGQLLLQQRASGKYHSAGLWSNTCCSHPKPGEPVEEGAHRRLTEEMGFDCPFVKLFSFIYKAEFENGLMEHELDHIFMGQFEGHPSPNPAEVENWMWADPEKILQGIKTNPENYTYWFRISLERVLSMSNEQ